MEAFVTYLVAFFYEVWQILVFSVVTVFLIVGAIAAGYTLSQPVRINRRPDRINRPNDRIVHRAPRIVS